MMAVSNVTAALPENSAAARSPRGEAIGAKTTLVAFYGRFFFP